MQSAWVDCDSRTIDIHWRLLERAIFSRPDPDLHCRVLGEYHFVSAREEVRIERHPGAISAHRVTERARMHCKAQHHPHHLEAAYPARDLGSGVGLNVVHAIVHVVVTIAREAAAKASDTPVAR